MYSKKAIACSCHAILLFSLTSWILPFTSRQQHLPEGYEKRLDAIKEIQEEKKEKKKQHKKVLVQSEKCSYLAYQKNRLARFADRDGFIWFRERENKYSFFLSNFYLAGMKIWNMKFSCAEAAFHAAKFLDQPELAVRFTHLDGEEAWKLAKRHSHEQKSDWYQTRETVMQEVLRAKFKQHADLTELLLATGDAYLVENSSRDAFWADGGDGKGKNRLGHLLMQLREELGGVGVISKPGKYKTFATHH